MTPFRERGCFYCEYCKSFHFPEETPDGLRLLGKAQEGINCPVCDLPLLVASFSDRYHGFVCEQCKGMLLDRDTFVEMLAGRRAWATDEPRPGRALDRAELDRQVRCPLCGELMETHPYYGPGTFVIDSCVSCAALWLDFGEFEQAVSAPGRDRGSAYRREADEQGVELSGSDDELVDIEVDLSRLLARLFF
jgi:Zn-finger nucleic acid-binding protein